MGRLVRFCAIAAGFGALNWSLSVLTNGDFDVFGAKRSTGRDALTVLIGLCAIYLLFVAIRDPKKAD